MPDFHVATIRFLNSLLKVKQMQMSKATHTAAFEELEKEFGILRQRLCLELVYAMSVED